MNIKVDFLSDNKSLLGFEYELLKLCNKVDKDKKPIIEDFHVFSIGLIFILFTLTIKAED